MNIYVANTSCPYLCASSNHIELCVFANKCMAKALYLTSISDVEKQQNQMVDLVL